MPLERSIRPEYTDFSVETLGLVDAATPPSFDSLTRLAKRLFNCPVALISIVQEEADRQYFLSQQGLAEPWRSARQTPLSHSFCQHVKRTRKPLVVNDAPRHPVVQDNLAIDDLGVHAYLGVPISLPDGTAIGALCVIDGAARQWTDEDLTALKDLARCVNDEILLRASLAANRREHEKTRRYNAMRESISMAFMTPDLPLETRFEHLLQASCKALGMTAGRIINTSGGASEVLFSHGDQNCLSGQDQKMLTNSVVSGSAQLALHDLGRTANSTRFQSLRSRNGRYIGAPLITNGSLYGALEFVGDTSREIPWSDEDLSIMSVVSMFVTANLEVCGQMAKLRNSEAALLRQMTDMKTRA